MKPIEGAESEGALGFFKGVGKGLVGYGCISLSMTIWLKTHSAVTKPVVGVFDLASNVSEGKSMHPPCKPNTVNLVDLGIRNTTTVFDNPERDRVRLVSYLVGLSDCLLPTHSIA
jgi:vacuolar protein sorting-associated protein 13A/C